MSITAKPIGVTYRNEGETNYNIGVTVVDENGDPVTVTGTVTILYIDLDGDEQELVGDKFENIAFYLVTASDFAVSGTYKYWVKCFDQDIYGPFELKIQDIA